MKTIIFVMTTVVVWCFFVLMASAAPYEKGYDKRAQDVIHNMIVKNGLDADIWPDYKPSQWPIAEILNAEPKTYGVRWSNSSTRQLTYLVTQPVKGSVDLSGLQALECLDTSGFRGGKRITSLNIKGNKALKILVLRFTDLSQVGVSELKNLEQLFIDSSGELTVLNLKRNRKLVALEISFCDLTSLDLSQNADLQNLLLSRVTLRTLDLRKNIKLKSIDITLCPLKKLNLSSNTSLSNVVLDVTSLKNIDLRHNSMLEAITILDTPLASLVLPDKLNKKKLFPIFSGTRLPLSQLAQLTGKHNRIDTQHNVFFEQKVFQPSKKAELDFSSEAKLLGASTTFTLVKELKSNDAEIIPVSTQAYTVRNGRITIMQPGRYQVVMTNPKILSYTDKGGIPHKISVFTGVIIVR